MKKLLKFSSLAKTLLVSAILFNGSTRDYLLIGITLVWLTGNLFIYIKSRGKNFIPLARNCIEVIKAKPEVEQPELVINNTDEAKEDVMDNAEIKEAEPLNVSVQSGIPAITQDFLMRNVNCRITEKLKRSFPEAAWEWETKNPLQEITESKNVRINTFKTNEFNCADVIFKPNGNISFNMIKSFEIENKEDSNEDKNIHEIDVKSWYEMVASNSIKDIINELYSQGHKKMFINEMGEVYFNAGKSEVHCGKVEHFLNKNLWMELIKCLKEDDISASISGNNLVLAW